MLIKYLLNIDFFKFSSWIMNEFENDVSASNKIDNLMWLFMIISHVSIIMKRIRVYCSIFVGQ